MTNETQPSIPEEKRVPFGRRLKNKREALGLERKDAAKQLRLNERIIVMMENDKYPADLPITFVRGYLRSYARLLEVPEFEITQILQLIQAKPEQLNVSSTLNPPPLSAAHQYFMTFFTYFILLTLAGLVGTWWYRHTLPTQSPLVENRQIILPNPPPSIEIHRNFVTNTNNAVETAAIPAISATIDKKAQTENKINAPEQPKALTNQNETSAVVATSSPQTVLSNDDNTDNQEDDNDTE